MKCCLTEKSQVLGFKDDEVKICKVGSHKECLEYCESHNWELRSGRSKIGYRLSIPSMLPSMHS